MTRLEEVQYLRTEPDGRHYNCAALLSKAKEEGIPKKEHCDSLVLEMAKILDEEFFAPEQ